MCEQREYLLDYLYEEASPASRREVERHLEGCEECRDEIRAFRNVREDLLAWSVPNPPSVWTPFAPAPVVPWHRQVPAWALAAAASLMFVVGSAGGFVAHSVVDGSTPAPAAPAEIRQASVLDSNAILSLIRQELDNAARDSRSAATPASNTTARPFQLDPKAQERLMERVSVLVNESQQRQLGRLSDYLFTVAQEDAQKRKEDDMTHGQLRAQVDQLEAQLKQLVLAQTKGQQ
jgi:anti-sigma factor RsiW